MNAPEEIESVWYWYPHPVDIIENHLYSSFSVLLYILFKLLDQSTIFPI